MTSALVLYHKNCRSGDGFACAVAAWLRFGAAAEYVAADSGDPVPEADGRDVYILDLSFDAGKLDQLASKASSLTLLDHHLTARESLRSYIPSCCGKIHFDLTQCAAVLSWKHFHPDKPVPRLYRWIQARDLWTWDDEPDARSFLAWLDLQPKTFESWKRVLEMSDEELGQAIEVGDLLAQQTKHTCESIASKASDVVIADEQGLMVNASGEFRSEVGALLAQRSGTFGLVWRVSEDGMVRCSLRAHPSYDVETLARKFNGGGHPLSASFSVGPERLPELARGSLSL